MRQAQGKDAAHKPLKTLKNLGIGILAVLGLEQKSALAFRPRGAVIASVQNMPGVTESVDGKPTGITAASKEKRHNLGKLQQSEVVARDRTRQQGVVEKAVVVIIDLQQLAVGKNTADMVAGRMLAKYCSVCGYAEFGGGPVGLPFLEFSFEAVAIPQPQSAKTVEWGIGAEADFGLRVS